MTFVIDFLVLTTIGLAADRVAFAQLRHTAESFWPLANVSYRATAFPRLFLLPAGAALAAYAKGPEFNILNVTGVILLVAPVVILSLKVIREFYRDRPRR
jgi:hypothetical protein